jgi:hypothetical protein
LEEDLPLRHVRSACGAPVCLVEHAEFLVVPVPHPLVRLSRKCRRQGSIQGVRIMNSTGKPSQPMDSSYELRFCSLFDEGRAYAFPCDAAGHVDMDALSDRARLNYLYARAVIGREVSLPAVLPHVH